MTETHMDEQPQLMVGIGLDPGQARKQKPNQDSVGIFSDYCDDAEWLRSKGRLFIVADGMGGAAGGKEASSLAVETVLDSYYDNADLEIVPCLARALQDANRQIKKYGEDSNLRGLGTTVVAAVIRDHELVVMNVGDSRAYLLRDGVLHQLSIDHTTVQDLVRDGLLSPEEAASHPRRHVLSRNLGSRARIEPDSATTTLVNGDVLFMCSDGLWGPVADTEIIDLLQRLRGQAVADALVERANSHGGPDNISVIAVHVATSALKRPSASLRSAHETEPALTIAPPPAQYATLADQTDPAIPIIPESATSLKPATLPRPSRQITPAASPRPTGRVRIWVVVGISIVIVLVALLVLLKTFFPTATTLPASLPQADQSNAQPTAVRFPTVVAQAITAFVRLEQPDPVRCVACAPGGQTLASATLDGTVKLWRISDGSLIASLLDANSQPAAAIAFGGGSQILAAGFSDGSIKLWRIDNSNNKPALPTRAAIQT